MARSRRPLGQHADGPPWPVWNFLVCGLATASTSDDSRRQFHSAAVGLITIECAGREQDSSFKAEKNPPALASVSSYSASGLESATMPAPTLKCARPSLQIAVRMVMLNWLSRLKPR